MPPQLVVLCGSERRDVELIESTAIYKRGTATDEGCLIPGLNVRITARRGSAGALTALRIEITQHD